MSKKTASARSRFIQKAKELGYDDSEAAFDAVLKKVAVVKPKKPSPKAKLRKK